MADANTTPPRPLRLRMATAARAVGKPQFVLEKDYALSYLLAGIAEAAGIFPLLLNSRLDFLRT